MSELSNPLAKQSPIRIHDGHQSRDTSEPSTPAAVNAASPRCISPQRADAHEDVHLHPNVLRHVAEYLTADDVRSLRLTGSKNMHLTDPSLTSHLMLRMDRASFFSADAKAFTEEEVRSWLENRRQLVINDIDAKICPNRVGFLVANGYLDSVSELIVFDCHAHHETIALLAQLPNLKGLMLTDQESDNEDVLDDLDSIVTCVGAMRSLKHLDIEFDSIVHGSRLSCLRNLKDLRHLRLRGFDLSEGIDYMRGWTSLKTLHLCHGNFFSSPTNDVNEKHLLNLMGLTNLEQVHLEGFDCLSNVGLKPFCKPSTNSLVLKHCQDLNEECLQVIGRMGHLTSLHIVNSAYDDTPIFDIEGLQRINTLVNLKSLSLFYVLEDDLSDLRVLWGLSSLETLNIALEDEIDSDELVSMCQSTILPTFPSLRKLRVFSENGMNHTCYCGNLEVEYDSFNFGDLVHLD